MKDKVSDFLVSHPESRTAWVAQALGITSYQARYYLQRLEEEGVVKRTPKRRGAATLWKIVS